MRRLLVLSAVVLTLSVTTLPVHAENACSGVDRALSAKRAEAYGPAVAKQLGLKRAKVQRSFRFHNWSILYVEPIKPEMENVFLFFSANPTRGRYVAQWSGAAAEYEERAIRTWTLKNAPGIPRKLAACFAWYVTKGR